MAEMDPKSPLGTITLRPIHRHQLPTYRNISVCVLYPVYMSGLWDAGYHPAVEPGTVISRATSRVHFGGPQNGPHRYPGTMI